jgi:hypothetical protein
LKTEQIKTKLEELTGVKESKWSRGKKVITDEGNILRVFACNQGAWLVITDPQDEGYLSITENGENGIHVLHLESAEELKAVVVNPDLTTILKTASWKLWDAGTLDTYFKETEAGNFELAADLMIPHMPPSVSKPQIIKWLQDHQDTGEDDSYDPDQDVLPKDFYFAEIHWDEEDEDVPEELAFNGFIIVLKAIWDREKRWNDSGYGSLFSPVLEEEMECYFAIAEGHTFESARHWLLDNGATENLEIIG